MLGLTISWVALRALTRGENAAVAIFAPFVCFAAASQQTPRRPLLAAQAVLYELAFDTVW